jgi:hypothetical protein
MNMKKTTLSTMVAGALFCSASMITLADTMTKTDYAAEKARINATQDADVARCTQLAGNARDVCKLEVQGARKVAMAQLDARNKATREAAYDVRVVRAKADYAVATEKCDDLAGNDKDVCVKAAKSAEVAALADAKANKKIVDAGVKANKTMVEAKVDANQDKMTAEYKVAVEKCDALAGVSKDNCVTNAKTRYGKS